MQPSPYRGREYEDDPRALPPQRLIRLAPDMVSGCGCAAAMCTAVGDGVPRSPEVWQTRPFNERAKRRIWGAGKASEG